MKARQYRDKKHPKQVVREADCLGHRTKVFTGVVPAGWVFQCVGWDFHDSHVFIAEPADPLPEWTE